MAKKIDKEALLKQTFLTLKDSSNEQVYRIIAVPELQIGMSSSAMGPRGLILPPHLAPPDVHNRLYNEDGTLKFQGASLVSGSDTGIRTVALAADAGGAVSGDTSISFSTEYSVLSMTASNSVTLVGNAADRAISIELTAGSGTGNVTMGSVTTTDNSVVTTDGTAARAVQEANATINTAGQALQVNSDTGITVGAGNDFKVSLSSDDVYIENVTSNKDIYVRTSGTGQVKFQPNSDSTDFFQVLDADGGTPVLNVDSTNERVGIGTDNPQDLLHLEKSNAAASIELDRNDSSISTGETLGNLYFGGTENGTTYDYGATVRAVADGDWTVGSDIPTRLEFWTVPDGSSTQTLRMRMRQDSTIEAYGTVLPGSDNTYDLGSEALHWANIYTGDLHLRNDRGNWTIIEEEDFLCVVNNITGKRYKMLLEPLDD